MSSLAYLGYLLLTLGIEVPLVVLLLGRIGGRRRAALAAVLATLITHPLLWFVWPRVVSPAGQYAAYVASGEALVVLVEACVLLALAVPASSRTFGGRLLVAAGASLAANAASLGVGLLIELVKRAVG